MDKTRLVVLTTPNGMKPLGINVLAGLGKENEEDFLEICSIVHAGTAKHENGVISEVFLGISDNRDGEDPYKFITKDILGKTFHFIIKESDLTEYAKIIARMAEDNYSYEWHGLKDVIDGSVDNPEPKGWVDLHKNIVFFVDKEMAIQMDEWLHCE